ncbi:NAD-dependent epimerase/dehydratase family protein [Microbacterium mitrae]|uniref:SDR family oxidoreductase n=1 Tax=Microbacterium mitrae TaxID=664640 RepID=A0A5C8HQ47_9MICO|nr:SDR family oxidoreductase [Microbacterium mitrae]TXK06134.1 SDR family oxidoreductase [Microbacterium mitrae]
MTRVLITGGSGFLGSHVVAALAEREDVDTVVSVDVREAPESRAGVTEVLCDITTPGALEPVIERYGIDTVVHLAAIVNPGHNVELEYRVDVTGSRNVLDACIATGVRRLVVSSSGAAYGYRADNPAWITEAWPTRGSDEFPYSRHKALVEQMLAEARDTHPKLEQVVFRIGTILGAGVKNQITALWDGNRILAIRGSESPFVFIWADDVAAAMVRASTGGPAGVFNIAGTGSMTVTEIAQRLNKRVLRVPAGLLAVALGVARAMRLTVHGPAQVGFLRYRPVLDNTALRETFGYVPSHTSAEAFEHYLQTHPGVARA